LDKNDRQTFAAAFPDDLKTRYEAAKRRTGDMVCNMDDHLAKDFVALWQSELTAAAADRELREIFTALVALWAGTANTALTQLARPDAPGSAKTAQPAGAAPAAPASDAGLAQIEQLNRRIAELEQILADLLDQRGGNAA
jgi:hypothetical protein